MKTPSPLLAGTSLALVLVLQSSATAGPAPPPAPPKPGTVQRQNTLKEALATPLDDVNIRKVQIPDVLKASMNNPYDLKGLTNCPAVTAEVRRIDAALGPDFDTPLVEVDESTMQQAKSGAATVTRVGAQMLMPFRGVVRQVSGANAHQRDLQDAVEAGSARRGFLKGIGMRMNCAQPAAPYGFRPAVPAPVNRRTPAPPPRRR